MTTDWQSSAADTWREPDTAGPMLPLYHRLARCLESAIQAGNPSLTGILGNEVQMAARFGVSRATMRRAILALVDKGLLVRKRGAGTYVVQPTLLAPSRDAQIRRELRLSSLFDDIVEQGHLPRTVVLTDERIRPPQLVVEALQLPPGQLALHLVRLRYAGPRPLAILENYLPGDFTEIDDFDPETMSLYRTLRGRGVSLRVATQRIGARNGTDEECRLLEEPRDSPMLTVDRLTQNNEGRVVEVANHLYRASQHEYTMTLVKPIVQRQRSVADPASPAGGVRADDLRRDRRS